MTMKFGGMAKTLMNMPEKSGKTVTIIIAGHEKPLKNLKENIEGFKKTEENIKC
jgi:pheromone shutdown protein TraB